jgi:hypothetical protein
MNSYSILFVTFFLIVILTSLFVPFSELNAQVPVEEYEKESGLNSTCSDYEIQPSESENDNINNITAKEKDEKFLTYGNSSIGYKIEYPNDWDGIQTYCLIENTDTGMIQSLSEVNFKSTPNSSKNGLLGITVRDDLIGDSIDEFVKVYSQKLGNKIESKENIMIDEKPSSKFIINAGNENKLIQITVLSNDKRYDITHPLSNLISNSTIHHMIRSFEILDKNAINSEDVSAINELG